MCCVNKPFDKRQQGVCASVRNDLHEELARTTFNTSKNPMSFSPLAPMIFSMKKFAFINFNNFCSEIIIEAPYNYRVVLKIPLAHVSAKVAPIDYCVRRVHGEFCLASDIFLRQVLAPPVHDGNDSL